MKKIWTVLMAMVAGISAAQAQSMLRVRLADNSQFNISLDDRYFNKRGTAVTVGELPYGRHKLRIFVYTQNRRGRQIEEQIYSGNVATYEGMVTLFVFDPYSHDIDVSEQDIAKFTNNHPPAHEADRFSEQYSENNGTQSNNNQNNSNVNNAYTPPPQGNGDVASPLSPEKMGTLTDSKMAELKTQVAAKKTDTEKLTLLKEQLKNEQISTVHVGDIMDWFNFESTKVDFAKWAYDITADKEYFGDVISKLSYKNYQEDLEKFIKGK